MKEKHPVHVVMQAVYTASVICQQKGAIVLTTVTEGN